MTNSEHSKINAIERKECDPIGSKSHYRDSCSKLYDSQRKYGLWQNQHMFLSSNHDDELSRYFFFGVAKKETAHSSQEGRQSVTRYLYLPLSLTRKGYNQNALCFSLMTR